MEEETDGKNENFVSLIIIFPPFFLHFSCSSIAVWDINTTKLIRRYRGLNAWLCVCVYVLPLFFCAGHVGWITDIDHHPTQSSVFISTGMVTMPVLNEYLGSSLPLSFF